MALTNNLFTEQLRPKTLESTILLPRIRQELERGVNDHLLLYGTCGVGKTTITRILSQGHDVLEINASLEGNIDIIRDRVLTFVTNSSLMDGAEQHKIVIFEECDAMSSQAWSSLRALIEKYSKTTRFIGNCNYIEKIPEPIQSRFNCISLAPINKDEENYLVNAYCERCKVIFDKLGIKYTDEGVQYFVNIDFPDMRTLVKKIQQMFVRGVKELDINQMKQSFDNSALYNIILGKPDPWNNYKSIMGEWGNKAEDTIVTIAKEFPEYIRTVSPQHINKLPLIVITCSEYQDQLSRAIDKSVTLLAMVYKLQMILNS